MSEAAYRTLQSDQDVITKEEEFSYLDQLFIHGHMSF